MLATTRLDASLLVGGNHEIIGSEGLSLPKPLVEIEDRAGLFHKPRVAWKDPTAMPPRAKRVLTEPAPDGGATNLGHESLIKNLLPDVGHGKAGERQSLAMR